MRSIRCNCGGSFRVGYCSVNVHHQTIAEEVLRGYFSLPYQAPLKRQPAARIANAIVITQNAAIGTNVITLIIHQQGEEMTTAMMNTI